MARVGVSTILFFIFISIKCISSNHGKYEQIWYDDMEIGSDWNVNGKASDEKEHCAIGGCVRIIEGTTIKREYLSTQNYDNIQLTYSIQVSNLKYNEFCSVYYSINGVKWTLLKQYDLYSNEEKLFNQIINLPHDTYNNPNVQIQFVYSSPIITKLDVNGSCYIDEIYLYGIPKLNVIFGAISQVIWYDNMESGDGWYFENTSDHTTNCYIGDCVEMTGNAYIERDGLSTKHHKNIELRYCIKTLNIEKGENCNVYYSVDNTDIDNTDWKLIASYNELFNANYQMNEVLDLPLDADNNENIQIKFNLTQNTNRQNTNNYCYIDEVYLFGIKQIIMDSAYIHETQILIAIFNNIS